ncbi:Crp/Fnr family transcriptional regulator [Tenacibaculum aquimarinum]|uniref:Crp/Fnr family transcriptional regulator n=1 Tax=Tenacibaculum aquimarinum TaxID=2910675 RepID=UPI001F0AF152|nr:Crp/Fnr family transcriptional regulator [Tenacibaculum aquimarinum]MCH3884499.1 Crp/Fnr family transcriptional regulator [Tenacibaculum aquimarinum]
MIDFLNKFDFQSHLLFEGLDADEIAQVNYYMEELSIKKGSMLFYEDGIPTGIFQLKKGRAKKSKRGFNGAEQLFYVYKPEDVLGYHALLSEERYQDSCEALEDLEVSFISKSNFLKLLADIPKLKDAFIKNMSHEFGVLANIVAVLAQKDQNTRLAIFLFVLQERFEQYDPSIDGVDLSREDLANCIGTSRESLGRSLKFFKDEGLIEVNRRTIKIKDKKGLLHYLGLDLALEKNV